MSTERIQMWMAMGQVDRAMEEIGKQLAENPEDGLLHNFRSVILLQRGKPREALEAAQQAIHFLPDMDAGFYNLARAHLDLNQFSEAHAAADMAIELDPDDASNFVLKAVLHTRRNAWAEGLEWVEQGLERDPENEEGNNIRVMCLRHLDRFDEADDGLDATLANNPNCSFTHANRGWTELHRGAHRDAMGHFEEALRLDPGNDYARNGFLAALRSSNPLYRMLLSFSFWLSRFSGGQRNMIFGGIFLFIIFQDFFAGLVPPLAPLIKIAVPILVLGGMMIWFALPISNGVLMLHPRGRAILEPREKRWTLIFLPLIPIASAAMVWIFVGEWSSRIFYLWAGLFGVMSAISSILEATEPYEEEAGIRLSLIQIGLFVILLILLAVGNRWGIFISHLMFVLALITSPATDFFSGYFGVFAEELASRRLRNLLVGGAVLGLLAAWHKARPLPVQAVTFEWESPHSAAVAPAGENAAEILVYLMGRASCEDIRLSIGIRVAHPELAASSGAGAPVFPNPRSREEILANGLDAEVSLPAWEEGLEGFITASQASGFYAPPIEVAGHRLPISFSITSATELSLALLQRIQAETNTTVQIDLADAGWRWSDWLLASGQPDLMVNGLMFRNQSLKAYALTLPAASPAQRAAILERVRRPAEGAEALPDIGPYARNLIAQSLKVMGDYNNFGPLSHRSDRKEEGLILAQPSEDAIWSQFEELAGETDAAHRELTTPEENLERIMKRMLTLKGGFGIRTGVARKQQVLTRQIAITCGLYYEFTKSAYVKLSHNYEARRRVLETGLLIDGLDATPTQLAELVPDVLPAVPLDPYSRQPLTYESAEGGMSLSSVGPPKTEGSEKPAKPIIFPYTLKIKK